MSVVTNFLWDKTFRFLYWYISKIDKKAEVIFMNYGFSRNNHQINLEAKDVKDRYSAQLYDYIARGADVKGKDILEVGSGRGGGLSYVTRYLLPKSATGLDLCEIAVAFCNKYHALNNLKFVQGNAQEMPFPDGSFEVVLNLESSHRYLDMMAFLNETYRVLKPDGYFLFTDFRHTPDLQTLAQQLASTQFRIIKHEFITDDVLEALDLSSAEREAMIFRLVPKFLHALIKDFAATKGSPTYNNFESKEMEYVYYVLQK
ncbi:MAG: class I SAM-dependent methyltransferase [Saprospiraceae bacterium]|nr:class I SAM-dependent methyltransferase [Saprospiraceae bacterium]